ncbi:hypothetical protein [Emticicia fontis]
MVKYYVDFKEVSYEEAIKADSYEKKMILNEFESKTEHIRLGKITFVKYTTLFHNILSQKLIPEHLSNYPDIEFSISDYMVKYEGNVRINTTYFYNQKGDFVYKCQYYSVDDIEIKEVSYSDFDGSKISNIRKYQWGEDDEFKAFEYNSGGKLILVYDTKDEESGSGVHYKFSEDETYYTNGLL